MAMLFNVLAGLVFLLPKRFDTVYWHTYDMRTSKTTDQLDEGRMDEKEAETVDNEDIEIEAEPVDLNKVFGEQALDLNSMFPDVEVRNFLQQVKKNKRSNERFLEGVKKENLWEEDE
jgi:hypothetical protein